MSPAKHTVQCLRRRGFTREHIRKELLARGYRKTKITRLLMELPTTLASSAASSPVLPGTEVAMAPAAQPAPAATPVGGSAQPCRSG